MATKTKKEETPVINVPETINWYAVRVQNNKEISVLEKLQNETNLKACFKTVIALIIDGKTLLFEGKVDGIIRRDKKGNQGFGYDPIFEPEGLGKTFAEMNIEEKSNYSHRKRAVDKMVLYLSTHF